MMRWWNFAVAAVLAIYLAIQAEAVSSTRQCDGVSLPLELSDSQTCLGCHDGTVAFDRHADLPDAYLLSPNGNHPVLISYNAAYVRNPRSFVEPSRLDPHIALLNGQVQCVSCHTATVQGTWIMVKSNNRSALCLSCHRK
jgi:predicted CXXCH cytochrome family protein